MRYYLDFDRTLFDTERFIPVLKERCAARGISLEGDFMKTLEEKVVDTTLSFAPGELSEFLYPDVAGFLREKGEAVTIITRGYRAFQEAKVQSALHGISSVQGMYVGQTLKGEYLASHRASYEDACAVDDEPRELESYVRHCQGLALFEMRRDGGVPASTFPVVTTLAELPV